MMDFDDTHLDAIFGADAVGSTPQARASKSKRKFVRSQSQIAFWSERANGLTINAETALDLVGFSGMLEILARGAAVIVPTLEEPSATFRRQRTQLDITRDELHRSSGLPIADIERVETPGLISPIRNLILLSQILGLDDDYIGARHNFVADSKLAVRLKTLRRQNSAQLSASLVLKLSEAAWVVSKQRKLASALNIDALKTGVFTPSDDYRRPAWRQGYRLAEKTRELLDIDPIKPIASVRKLIEGMGIPLLQANLGQYFAGATLQNGKDRGIVVNVEGDNANVWVRRATLCHELGHLLWDPSQHLMNLHVDRYDHLHKFDVGVEARANAFAIAFLAPKDAVVEIIQRNASTMDMLSELMDVYGLAQTAARYHLKNVAEQGGYTLDEFFVDPSRLPDPSDEWQASENSTIDYFPISDVPLARRGRFSGVVVKSHLEGRISLDQAASYLKCDVDKLKENLSDILSVCLGESVAV